MDGIRVNNREMQGLRQIRENNAHIKFIIRRDIFIRLQLHKKIVKVWHCCWASGPCPRQDIVSRMGSARSASENGSLWPDGMPTSRPT